VCIALSVFLNITESSLINNKTSPNNLMKQTN
jgi:hypothetical protein